MESLLWALDLLAVIFACRWALLCDKAEQQAEQQAGQQSATRPADFEGA